jgi:hypothetical protein
MGGACGMKEEGRNVYRLLVRKFEGKILLRKPGVIRDTILKRILKKWNVRIRDENFWLTIRQIDNFFKR